MKTRLLIWVLWPSFLVSCLAEGLLFTFISPEDLSFFTRAQTVGMQAWMDTSINLCHVGSHVFEEQV